MRLPSFENRSAQYNVNKPLPGAQTYRREEDQAGEDFVWSRTLTGRFFHSVKALKGRQSIGRVRIVLTSGIATRCVSEDEAAIHYILRLRFGLLFQPLTFTRKLDSALIFVVWSFSRDAPHENFSGSIGSVAGAEEPFSIGRKLKQVNLTRVSFQVEQQLPRR